VLGGKRGHPGKKTYSSQLSSANGGTSVAKRVVIDGVTYEFAEDGNLKRVEGRSFFLKYHFCFSTHISCAKMRHLQGRRKGSWTIGKDLKRMSDFCSENSCRDPSSVPPSRCGRAVSRNTSKAKYRVEANRCALCSFAVSESVARSSFASDRHPLVSSSYAFGPSNAIGMWFLSLLFWLLNTQEEEGKAINRNALSLFHKDR
jgi:hypothetical protein